MPQLFSKGTLNSGWSYLVQSYLPRALPLDAAFAAHTHLIKSTHAPLSRAASK